MGGLTYEGAGVDYGALDPFKRRAQRAAAETSGHLRRLGIAELSLSRGESAYLV
jgi:hypothetical protein